MFLRKNHPWDPGYALPGHVTAEPMGRGVYVTKYTPRKTIATYQPSMFRPRSGKKGIVAKPYPPGPRQPWLAGSADLSQYMSMGDSVIGILETEHGKGGGGVFDSQEGKGVLGDDTLGTQKPLQHSSNPIMNFGLVSAAATMKEVRKLPPKDRKKGMKAILDAIDPKLWSHVADRTAALKEEKGYNATLAMEKALAAAYANRYLEQLIEIGKKGKPAMMKGLTGLGIYEALGWPPWDQIKSAGQTVGGAVAGAAKAVGSAVGKASCVAANSGVLAPAATAGGLVAGGPAGAVAAGAGATGVSALCNKSKAAPPSVPPPAAPTGVLSSATGKTALVVGGVGLAALLGMSLLRRK